MQVGKIKDQGLYNKPSAAVHPGALVAGPYHSTIIHIHICTKLMCEVHKYGKNNICDGSITK